MTDKINEVVIVAAARTPIGTYKGHWNIKADKLGSIVIEEVINRAKINKTDIDEVIITGFNRRNWTKPCSTSCNECWVVKIIPAHLVNQVCGSGLRSVISGFQTVKLNEAKYLVCGVTKYVFSPTHYHIETKKLSEDMLLIAWLMMV